MVAMQKVSSEHVLLYRYLYMGLPYPDNPHHFQNQLYYLKVLFAKDHYWIIRKKNFRGNFATGWPQGLKTATELGHLNPLVTA